MVRTFYAASTQHTLRGPECRQSRLGSGFAGHSADNSRKAKPYPNHCELAVGASESGRTDIASNGLPISQQAKLAADIYKAYGRWSTVCSAIVCWAIVASLE